MSKQLQYRLETLKSERSKALNVKASLVLAGKEATQEARDLEANLSTINKDIALIEKLTSMPGYAALQEQQEAQERSVQNVATAQQVAAQVTESIAPAFIKSEKDERAKYNRAYRQFFKTGETRDVITSNSGAVIPQLFADEFVETLKQISPIGTLVKVIPTDAYGRPVKQAVVNDVSSTLTYLPESTTVEELDPSLGSALNTPSETDTLATMVRFSNELLSDAFDLIGFLKEVIAVRCARSLEASVLLAQDGAGTVLPNSTTGGLLASASVGQTTINLAAGVGYGDMAKLKASIDRAYSSNDACFIVSNGLYASLEASVDTTGRPTYQFVNGVLQVAGKSVYASNLLSPLGTANGIAALYGSFKEAWVMQASQIAFRFVRERFAHVNESALIANARVAGTSSVGVTGSVKALKLAAS